MEDRSIPELPPAPRETMVATAVKFLQNPQVQGSTEAQKRAFLRKKGLSDGEIQLALEQSRSPLDEHRSFSNSTSLAPVSMWTRLKEFLSTVVIVGGLGYVTHQIYQKYIAPYLFGPSSQEKTLEALEKYLSQLDENVKHMSKEVEDIQQSLSEQKDDVKQVILESSANRGPAELNRLKDAQFANDIKAEITSLKGLLLNRKQFPQTPKTAPILPSWQLVNKDSEVKDEAGDKENRLDAAEKAEDVENTAPLDSQTGNSSDKSEENIKVDEDSSSGDVQHPDSDFGDGVVVNPTSSVESLNAESAVIDEESDSQSS